MNRILATTAALLLAAPAFAQIEVVEGLDLDQDGFVTLEEAQAVYPDLPEPEYGRLDEDENNLLDESELGSAEAVSVFGALERASD